MNLAIFAYSKTGCNLALTLQAHLGKKSAALYTTQRLKTQGFQAIPSPASSFYGEQFRRMDAMIFVGACGIAVRQIAPFVADKREDPAVLVIDERGNFVISLLSGHIGGANALAKLLAEKIGAVPVVTTATDVNGRFSPDAWAAQHNMAISSMALCKKVSAGILEGDVPLCSDYPIRSPLPQGLTEGKSGPLGIYVTAGIHSPFESTLRLIPRILHVGIGCRKDTGESAIRQAVAEILEENHLDRKAVKCAASIDIKQNEPGLLEFCRKEGWPLSFYSAEELRAVPGEFTPSPFVEKVTGVNNVCERAAVIKADRLIVRKSARNGVTVAVAQEKLEVYFG